MADDLRVIARREARESGLDEETFIRQIYQESKFNPNAHNPKSGADGIAQIVPKWHPTMQGKTKDPIASLDYAANLMADHLRTYRGSYAHALAAYNWGPGSVSTWSGKFSDLPGETQTYLRFIIGPDLKPSSGDEGKEGPGADAEAGSGWLDFPSGSDIGTSIVNGALSALKPPFLAGFSGPDLWWAIAFGAAGIALVWTGALGLAWNSGLPQTVAQIAPQTRAVGAAAATVGRGAARVGQGAVRASTAGIEALAPRQPAGGQVVRFENAAGRAARAARGIPRAPVKRVAQGTAEQVATGVVAAQVIV